MIIGARTPGIGSKEYVTRRTVASRRVTAQEFWERQLPHLKAGGPELDAMQEVFSQARRFADLANVHAPLSPAWMVYARAAHALGPRLVLGVDP